MTFDELLKQPLPSKRICYFSRDFIIDENFYEAGTFVHGERLSHNLSNVKISVYSGDGNKPHFHVKSINKKRGDKKSKDDGFETCIRLDTNEYFRHGNKTGKLNNSELKSLVALLNKPIKSRYGVLPLYTILCKEWNRDIDQTTKVNEDISKIPDYLNMKEG